MSGEVGEQHVGTALTTMLVGRFAELLPPSVTLICGVNVPVPDNVPVSEQVVPVVDPHPLRPVGREPVTVHVSVPAPQLLAVNWIVVPENTWVLVQGPKEVELIVQVLTARLIDPLVLSK